MQNRELWVGLARYLASAVVGAIFAAFVLGRNAQKINDVVAWKAEAGPRIERMDRQGTISFELFDKNYEKREAAMEIRVRDIEKEIKDIYKRIDP